MCPRIHQAALTFAIDDLAKVDGHEDIMSLALSVATVDQARFVVNSMRMLLRYHETIQTLQSITVGGMVTATNKKGSIVIAAPVDYLSWSKKLDKFSGLDKSAGKKHELYIAGTMTEMAKSHFKEQGWELHENSNLLMRIITPKKTRN